MHVAIINRFFWPDESATSMLATDLATDLVAAGHTVEVIASDTTYRNPKRLAAREDYREIRINRIGSLQLPRTSTIARMVNILLFHLGLCFRLSRLRADRILVLSDPPMLLATTMAFAWKRDVKVVHFLMDIYPDILLSSGWVGSDSILGRILERASRRALRQCDRVVTLSGEMRGTILAKGIAKEKLTIVPPWFVGLELDGHPSNISGLRAKLEIPEEAFAVMYSGNMGWAHDLNTIARAAIALRDEPSIWFVFVGDGPGLSTLRREIGNADCRNVVFHPFQPRERVTETLALGDAHLVTLKARSLGLMFPSKLAGVLAVGRPVIFVGPKGSETARLVQAYNCGVTVESNDHEGLVGVIKKLASDRALLLEMKANALELYAEKFERKKLTADLIKKLEEL